MVYKDGFSSEVPVSQISFKYSKEPGCHTAFYHLVGFCYVVTKKGVLLCPPPPPPTHTLMYMYIPPYYDVLQYYNALICMAAALYTEWMMYGVSVAELHGYSNIHILQSHYTNLLKAIMAK